MSVTRIAISEKSFGPITTENDYDAATDSTLKRGKNFKIALKNTDLANGLTYQVMAKRVTGGSLEQEIVAPAALAADTLVNLADFGGRWGEVRVRVKARWWTPRRRW